MKIIRSSSKIGIDCDMLNIIMKIPYNNGIYISHVYYKGWDIINKIHIEYNNQLYLIVKLSLKGHKWITDNLDDEIKYWEELLFEKAKKRFDKELDDNLYHLENLERKVKKMKLDKKNILNISSIKNYERCSKIKNIIK